MFKRGLGRWTTVRLWSAGRKHSNSKRERKHEGLTWFWRLATVLGRRILFECRQTTFVDNQTSSDMG